MHSGRSAKKQRLPAILWWLHSALPAKKRKSRSKRTRVPPKIWKWTPLPRIRKKGRTGTADLPKLRKDPRPPGMITQRFCDKMSASIVIFTKINFHHCKSASAVPARRMAKMHTCISLVQEPWLYKTKITGLRVCGQLIYGRVANSRVCLLVKGLRMEALCKYCLRDLATAKFRYKDEKDGM